MSKTEGVESKVREIRRKTRRTYSAEKNIRIVLGGLRGEESISALCRREGITPNPPTRTTAGAKSSWKRASDG